jgi:hypothetical protein
MKRGYLIVGVFVACVSTCLAAEAKNEQAATAEAQSCYEQLLDTYLHFEAKAWDTVCKASLKFTGSFTAQQKADIAYMRKTALEYRPDWWKSTKSSSSVSFPAVIWGKTFTANYKPSEFIGGQQLVFDSTTGKLHVVVTWQPHMVDSTKVLEGDAAAAHQMTEGNEAEAIIWHELGHNYVTLGFDMNQLYDLYTKYEILYMSLQEFYADMTALYHCSPPGRKATFLIRVPSFHWNDVNDPHVRGALGVGSYLLATILSDPAKWPSFHLPTTVPETDPERKCILYMYEHLDPRYTLEEDRNLRELVGQLIKTRGATIFRSKGAIPLPNKLEYKITPSEDRDLQVKRDAWVAAALKKAIDSGAVVKVQVTKGHPRRFRLKPVW